MAKTLIDSPDWYPLAIDQNSDFVQFVKLSEQEYAEASFLDSRLSIAERNCEICTWQKTVEETTDLTADCHFIFHISHVGSTLLSRLLGGHPRLFALREPAILRRLAEVNLVSDLTPPDWTIKQFDDRLNVFLKLWSRTYRDDQRSLVKATSFSSDLAHLLLERIPQSRAILMYVQPIVFLRALLSGTLNDIRSNAANRLTRLSSYLGVKLREDAGELSPGECVAMSWLTEFLALKRTDVFSDRVLWLDFDLFLKDPPETTRCLLCAPRK